MINIIKAFLWCIEFIRAFAKGFARGIKTGIAIIHEELNS